MSAERIIQSFFGTDASRRSSANAQGIPGSPEHVNFAKQAAQFAKEWDGDFARMTEDLANAALEFFRKTSLHPAARISVVRDIVPFVVGSAWWSSIGSPVFNLTLDFFRAVRITDFGDVGLESMYGPYPAYLVRFPEALKDGIRTGFVYPVPAASGTGNERAIGFQASRFSLAAPIVAEDRAELRQVYTQWPNTITYSNFLNCDARTMEEADAIERVATELYGMEMDSDVTKQARRVLGNTLLYINANGGLPSEKRVGLEVPVEREQTSTPRFRVGRPIKLGPQIRAALEPGQSAEMWKLSQRFVVRGHWRNQAYGTQHSLRRKQWIPPFWKGPETVTEAMQRTFEVE